MRVLVLLLLLLPLTAVRASAQSPDSAAVPADTAREAVTPVMHVLDGVASYYSSRLVGRSTASGEPYHPDSLTAAHRTLPFGTRVRVTNQRNGRSVVLRINDRGPFRPKSRIIDVSARAAKELGFSGIVRVQVDVLPPDSTDVPR